MDDIKTGWISGLVATVFAGSMLLLNNALHGIPEIHIARTLSRILGSPDGIMSGVIGILVIGILVFGGLFPFVARKIPLRSYFAKGIALGAASWLFMMLVFMPLGGSGFFGMNGGSIVPTSMLALNLGYWVVLGVTYRWMQGPAGEPESGESRAVSLDSRDGR